MQERGRSWQLRRSGPPRPAPSRLGRGAGRGRSRTGPADARRLPGTARRAHGRYALQYLFRRSDTTRLRRERNLLVGGLRYALATRVRISRRHVRYRSPTRRHLHHTSTTHHALITHHGGGAQPVSLGPRAHAYDSGLLGPMTGPIGGRGSARPQQMPIAAKHAVSLVCASQRHGHAHPPRTQSRSVGEPAR